MVLDLNDTKCDVIAAVVALVVVISIYSLVPPLSLVPQGIFLPTTLVSVPISHNISHNSFNSFEQVNFYNLVTIPYTYKRLGYINVEYSAKAASLEKEEQIQRYVAQIATQEMANGVIVTLFGHTIPGSVKGELSSYIFRGIAIYAIPKI